MNGCNPINLELLLEQLGSVEAAGDPRHRYNLRRVLMHSRCFERNRLFFRCLDIFSWTTSVVAGSAIVVACVLVVTIDLIPAKSDLVQMEQSIGEDGNNRKTLGVKSVPTAIFADTLVTSPFGISPYEQVMPGIQDIHNLAKNKINLVISP